MPPATSFRITRVVACALLLSSATVPLLGGSASAVRSAADLRVEMFDIQTRLDAATAKVEQYRTLLEEDRRQIAAIQSEMDDIQSRYDELEKAAVARARELYMSGQSDVLEALLGSGDFSEVVDKVEALSAVSLGETPEFTKLARARARLRVLKQRIRAKNQDVREAQARLRAQIAALQQDLKEANSTYQQLLKRQVAPNLPSGARIRGGMACPVAGPVSFVDSWGAPRSGGRSHEGTDLMAAYGTPVVAIVSGTIKLSSYGGSAGYWQILAGDDGNEYWYMHNQRNIVNGGHVKVGQQIATVGDTGNAAGAPHVHFEFHPGGGGPVNPYPLVASIC